METTNNLMLEYETYIKTRASIINQKFPINYSNYNLRFTPKQMRVLELIAKGYSNRKIAKTLLIKESTLKLITYRLMKYLESIRRENIDRFYLIIIAQEIVVEYEKTNSNA